jgi:type IV pilus assembly protein PilB
MAINESTLINAAVQRGLVDTETVSVVKKVARRERIQLLEALMRERRLPLSAFYQALAELKRLPFLQVPQLRPAMDMVTKVPANLAQRRGVLPIRLNGQPEVLLAMQDPDDRVALDSVRRVSPGITVRPAMTDPIALKAAIGMAFGELTGPDGAAEIDSVQLFDDIMKEAYIRRATDIHFEPTESGMKIRMRADGHMQRYPRQLGREEAESLMTRIKVLSGVDISEQRMAQDGGFSYAIQEWFLDEVDMRLATVPTRYGERATLRILGQDTKGVPLDALGMQTEMLLQFRDALTQSHGLILVTGPTGSGKSTTLYAALGELDRNDQNILTVEDPVEQLLDGVAQVQVSAKVGFASALRSFLRHDPDVILVGEIRDYETADTALKAAMTGHMVLSTLHTNDAVSAVTRLCDIGCERYLVASTLTGAIAQRLVRRICTVCAAHHPATEEEQELLSVGPEQELATAVGCAHCLGSGYQGRVGIYEALWVDDELRQQISTGADEKRLRTSARQLTTLWQDAREKVIRGETTLSEVIGMRAEWECD